ncbi:hypothetical protein [Companilactobacillus metriopterae]|uniref:hypothetical protein n=1 Tax=Companilactobacillus metriopterae TaxID=1909267 RepID=UPI00100ADA39|nr:hypothetical protein [Companilactobacillus metriopterae]
MKLKTIRCIASGLILITFFSGMYLNDKNILSSGALSLIIASLNLIIILGFYAISKTPKYKDQPTQAVSKAIVIPLIVILAIMMLLPLIIQFLIVI